MTSSANQLWIDACWERTCKVDDQLKGQFIDRPILYWFRKFSPAEKLATAKDQQGRQRQWYKIVDRCVEAIPSEWMEEVVGLRLEKPDGVEVWPGYPLVIKPEFIIQANDVIREIVQANTY